MKKGCRFISIDECYSIFKDKKEPIDKVIYFSFDDGWKSNLKLIPIIEKYNVPITIFVAVDPIAEGNYWWEYALKKYTYTEMNAIKRKPYCEFKAEITKLKSEISLERSSITEEELQIIANHPLISVQSHTMSHPILTACPDEVLKYELEESKKYLETRCNKEVYAFSYTNGDFSDGEIEAVKVAGYKIAFTTQSDYVNISNNKILQIPRMAINTNGGYYENLAKIVGIWQRMM